MNRLLTLIGSFLLIFFAVFCTFGALISSFAFETDSLTLFFIWAFAALALATLTALWRGKGLLVFAPFALAFIYWKLSDIVAGAKFVVSFVTGEFNKWMNIPVIFPEGSAAAPDPTLFFAAAGIVLAFLLAIVICLRRSAFFTVLFTAPIVFLTFVLIGYPADTLFLLGLLAVYLTVLISGAMRPGDAAASGRAVFPALALALALLGVAYIVAPTGNDRRGELLDSIDSRLRSIVADTGFIKSNFGVGWPEIFSDIWRFDTQSVRITDAGPRSVTGNEILKISASQPGVYYLRGYSMERFDGRAWQDNSDLPDNLTLQEALARAMPAFISSEYSRTNPDSARMDASMTIDRSGDFSNITYLPYYSMPNSDINTLRQNGYFNTAGHDTYTVDFFHTDIGIAELSAKLDPNKADPYLPVYREVMRVDPVYTQVDASTAKTLREIAIAHGIDPSADRAEIADEVAQYISSAARYTLSPAVIPDEADFAVYFLQNSREGYCIHFATAATLMLRSLGIPARFTSGFIVTVPDGKTGELIGVTDRQAHAWVEVYYDGLGWLPLEVTPSSPASGIPSRAPHLPPGETAAPVSPPDDTSVEPYPPSSPQNGSSPSPSPSPSPSLSPGQAAQNPPVREKRAGAALFIICAAALIAFIAIRRAVTLRLRAKRLAQADTNAAIIYAWRYILRLDRKNQPPEGSEALALRARFSQHSMSEDERSEMLSYASKLADGIFHKYYLPGRLWLKWIRNL